jgi:hypothetical protein
LKPAISQKLGKDLRGSSRSPCSTTCLRKRCYSQHDRVS